ncbi:MAG: hypothetical protein JSS65_04080 [Armatimonadetes bacterium]|nr:hypothetical protein [Armatimonadota bacterium]
MADLFPSLIGGSLGLLLGLYFGFNRFSDHLSSYIKKLEEAARQPLSTDWTSLVAEAKQLESEGRSLVGIARKVIGR